MLSVFNDRDRGVPVTACRSIDPGRNFAFRIASYNFENSLCTVIRYHLPTRLVSFHNLFFFRPVQFSHYDRNPLDALFGTRARVDPDAPDDVAVLLFALVLF